jgi:transposase
MGQIHKRFTSEQLKFLFRAYLQGNMKRTDVQEALGIGKSHFFSLLGDYRRAPETFSLSYARSTPPRLSPAIEAEIKKELLREKKLVEDPRLPISGYNYSALRDRLEKRGIRVSATTITARAKALGCYRPRPKKKVHDREVLTSSIGALVQHDASLHLWSPYALEKWTLITSIDDYSRKLLFADFFLHETTWNHIQAAEILMDSYGIPLRFPGLARAGYVDSLRIFRFVQGRDNLWGKHVPRTAGAG